MDATVWAALLKGLIGPVMVFALFGAAWLVGKTVWRRWPEGPAKRWMMTSVHDSGKTVAVAVIALLAFVSLLVLWPEIG